MKPKLIDFCMCLSVISIIFLVGCKEPDGSYSSKKDGAKKATETGIFNRKTTDIGEYDESAKRQKSDSEIQPTNPLNPLGALSQYDAISQEIAGMGIDYHLSHFNAIHGRYPKSHEEFMEKVIKPNRNLKLPVLSGGKEYQYDVKNHKLVVVESADSD